jgi:O-antigen/teichoic acid export membrane protein
MAESQADKEGGVIASRALRGGLVTAGGTVAGFLVRFGSNAFFARQMTPEEYGAWGFAAVWASLAALPYALSLPTAMLQAAPGARHLFGTVVRLSVKLAAAVMAVSLVAAIILWQVQGETVAQCFLALALGQAIASVGLAFDAALQRAMRYHVVAGARLAGVLLGLAVTVPLAALTPGPLVLALRDVLPPVLGLGLVAIYLRRHRGALALDGGHDPETARAVLTLGRGLLVNRMFEALVNRLDSLLVGLALGERALGSFDQAKYLAGLPNAVTGTFTHSVALRTFAAVRDDPPRLGRALALLQWATARVGLAGTTLCLAAPGLLVTVLFGPGWELSVGMLQAFAPWLTLVPLVSNLQVFLTAVGALTPIRQALLLSAVVLPAGVAVALAADAAWLSPLGNGLGYLAMLGVLVAALGRLGLGIAPGRLLRDLLAPPALAAAAGTLAAALARFAGFASADLAGEAIAGGLALLTYAAALFFLEGRALMAELRYLRASLSPTRP